MATALRLDWCSYQAAKYAVEQWHYSHTMPAGKLSKIGVWEAEKFVGCILFGRGANNHIGMPYGLSCTQIAELTRIALTRHQNPVSCIASIAVRMLKKQAPGLRLLLSYADPTYGHYGGIYQAMGWLYTGVTKGSDAKYLLFPTGRTLHARTAANRYGTNCASKLGAKWMQTNKHRYLCPLDLTNARSTFAVAPGLSQTRHKHSQRCDCSPYSRGRRNTDRGAFELGHMTQRGGVCDGPPTKLTPAIYEAIIRAVSGGVPLTQAAALADIDQRTVYQWLERGAGTFNGRPATPLYVQFVHDIQKAKAQDEARRVLRINQAGQGGAIISEKTTTYPDGRVVREVKHAEPQWTADAWHLERSRSETWARKERVDLRLTIQQAAEKVAAELGLTVEEVLTEAEGLLHR